MTELAIVGYKHSSPSPDGTLISFGNFTFLPKFVASGYILDCFFESSFNKTGFSHNIQDGGPGLSGVQQGWAHRFLAFFFLPSFRYFLCP